MSYIGTEPKDIRSFGRTKFDYTATQGQTAFTGADDDGKVLAFTVGQIEVYVNGILMDDSDFTTTGTGTVTLVSAANLNDVINIVSFETNIPDSDYVPASGGTFSGNVTHSGTVAHTGDVTITGNANDANGNLKVTTNTPANYPAMVIETSTGGNSTEVHGLHIKNTAAGHGLRIDDESSDTTPVVVTSDGKLGVGTTTPDVNLYVKDANSTPARLESTSANCYLQLMNNNDGNGNYLGSETTNINLWTDNVKRLNINSSGIVTMPYQPAVSGRAPRPTPTGGYITNSTNIYWGDLAINNGNHWNNSTGVWTCPVTGKYWVYAGFLIDNDHGNGAVARFHWLKNGSPFFIGYDQSYDTTSTYGGMVSAGGIFNCNTNDTITLQATNGYLHAGGESHFTIYLIG